MTMLQINKRIRRAMRRKESQKAAETSFKGWMRQLSALVMIYAVLLMTVPAQAFAAANRQNAFPKNGQSKNAQIPQTENSQTLENSQIPENKQNKALSENFAAAQNGQTATELENGDVLIVGGNRAEIYFTTAGKFGATGAPIVSREDHAAVRLNDGRVLISGGRSGKDDLRSTEIFDPATGSFTAAAEMNSAFANHTATLLADGRVLIAGGGKAEIYDATSNSFTAVGAMSETRSGHSAVLLNDGRILIVGGVDEKGKVLDSAEFFDSSANEFTAAGEMRNARKNAVLRVLHDGKVQIIGGGEQPTMEVFDPNLNSFGANAKIPSNANSFPELFNDIMSSPTRAAILDKGVIELPQAKKALVYDDANGLQNGKIFNSSKATISTEAIKYPSGTQVIVTGKGFMPSETVELVFYDLENPENQPRFAVQTNENGELRFDGFTATETNRTILLSAKGAISDEKAQTPVENAIESVDVKVNHLPLSSNKIYVKPSGTLAAEMTVQITGSSSWQQTSWRISNTSSSYTCVDTEDHGAGTFAETFPMTAPATVGLYNAAFRIHPTGCTVSTSYTENYVAVIQVVAGSTTTTVSSSPNPSMANASVTFTATVTGTSPSGTVDFYEGDTFLGTGTLSGGTASISVSNLSAGDHTVTAYYRGNSSSPGSEGSTTHTVDATAPTATVSNAYATPTNVNPVVFLVTFSESVTGADSSAGYTVTNGVVASVSGSGDTRTVNVTPTADGEVKLKVNAAAATDAAGNANTESNESSVTYDGTKPTPTVSSAVNTTNISPISFSVDFGESVSGGNNAADYAVVNGTIETISGTGATRTISVSPNANGIVSLKANAGAATDTAGNTSNESNTKQVTYDSTQPSVTVSPLTGLTNVSPIVFSIEFSEPVTDFDDSTDYTVDNGSAVISGGGQSYTATVTPNGQGAVTFAVNADAAVDGSNNGNTASATASVTYDSVSPVPTISNTYMTGTSISPVVFTVSFSEPVGSGQFTASDIVLSGTANPKTATVSTTDNQIFTVSVKGMNASGQVTLNIAAGAASDAAGNASTAAAENSAVFNLITTPQLVLPSTSPQPWGYFNEVTNQVIPGTDFVSTATISGHGIGAARVKSLTGEKTLFLTQAYNGSRFDELTEFSFWFKQDETDPSPKTPYVNFGIDFDSDDAILPTVYQGRLTYVPNVATTPGTWQKIDLTTGMFYLTSTMSAGSNACRTQLNLCTLQQILSNYPNLNLPNAPIPGAPNGFGLIGIRVDGDSTGFTAYFDGIVVGKNSSNTDFDFEPAATVSLSDPSTVYDGSPHGTTATTTPGGLTVDLEYTGVAPTVYGPSSTPPTNAGTYSVTGTINDSVYVGSATLTFTISKAPATLSFVTSTLTQIYDGSPRAVSVETDPTGLSGVSVTYGPSNSTTPPTNGGTYSVSASLTNDNYTASSITETLTVNPAQTPISVNDPGAKTYGDAPFTVSSTSSGSSNAVEFSSQTSSVCSVSGSTVTIHNAGNCTIRAFQPGDSNYQDAEATRTVSVSKKTLVVSIGDQTVTYGDTLVFTPSYSGFVNGDTVSVLSAPPNTPPTCSINSSLPNAGTHPITCSGGSSNNYSFDLNDTGTLTVNPAPASSSTITITFESGPYVYRGTPFTATARVTGAGGLDQDISSSIVYTGSSVDGSGGCVNAGTCRATATFSDGNHEEVSNFSEITITKAPATITISNTAQDYNGSPRPVTIATNPGGLESSVSVTYDGSPTAPTNGGSYAVVASLSNPNYQADHATATLVISAINQNLEFTNPGTRVYGDADFALEATGGASGNPVTFESNSSSVCTIVNDTAVHIVSAGTCSITASQAGNSNYNPALVTQSFTVSKKPLTVTADNQTITFGDDDPEFTFSYDGFVNGDDRDDIDTPPTCDVSGAHTNAGTYTIVCAGGEDNNYSFQFAPGTLTVEKAAPTVTWGDPSSIVYGTPLSSTQLNAASPVDGSFVYSPAAGTVLNAGTHTLSVTFTPTDTVNYTTQTDTVEIVVTKAPLTVTASSHTVYYGDPVPAVTASYATFVNGDTVSTAFSTEPVCSTTYTTSSAANSSQTTNCADGVSSNYELSYQSGTVTVQKANQTITFDPIPDKFYGDPDFSISPSASSGLPVSLSASSSPIAGLCTITGTTVHLAGAGTCTITATQAGNSNYNPAPPVARTFTIQQLNTPVDVSVANPTVRATLPSSGPVTIEVPIVVSDVTNHGFTSFEFTVSYDHTKLTPTAVPVVVLSSDVANPYSGSIISNVIEPGKLSVQGSGILPLSGSGRLLSLQFTSNEIGCTGVSFGDPQTFVFNDGMNPLNISTGTVCVAEDTTTTVTFESGPYVYRGTPFTAAATVTGNRTGDVLTTPAAVLTYGGDCLNVTTANGCSASATFAGNDTRNPSSGNASITITKRQITVSATANNKAYDGTTTAIVNLTLSPVVAGGSATYTSADFDTANVGTGKTVTISGINLDGVDLTNNELVNTTATATADIYKADQTITFAPLSNKFVDAPDFNVTATGGGSGEPVTFAASPGSVCTVTPGGLVDVIYYGTCTITASQAGNSNYNPAPDVSQSFDVIPYTTPLNVSLPSSIAPTYHGEIYTIPVTVPELGLHAVSSATFDLTYNPAVWSPTASPVLSSAITSSSGVVWTTPSPGTLRVTITAPVSTYLSGSGTLVSLVFRADNTGSGTFAFSSFTFNAGTPLAITNSLSTTVTNGNITGTVTNFYNSLPVPDVTMTASGLPVVTGTTDNAGVYDLFGFGDGSYTVTPSKPAEPRTTTAILSNDVSMIQRHRVGLPPIASNPSIPWDSKMQAAADVDQNGFVQSFDAALIQQFRAGIPNVVNQTGSWKFTDSSKTYANVFTPKTAQDYTALLLGDVDGNWTAGSLYEETKPRVTEKSVVTEYVKPQVGDISPLAVNVSLPTASVPVNAIITQDITVGNLTGQTVTSYDFDIVYNPAVVQPALSLINKTDTLSSDMSVVANVVSPGRLAVSASGINPLNGSGVLLKVIWQAVGNSGDTSALTFDPFIFNGGAPAAVVTNGQLTLSVVTAQSASVAGRVLSPEGKPLGGAIVTITGQDGQTAAVRTNNFGIFKFESLPIGQTYILSAKAKGYTFSGQTLNLFSNQENIEITALP